MIKGKTKIKQREKESDRRMKDIAAMSLKIPARVFVYLAVGINENMNFWAEWKELKDVVYQDERMKNYIPQEVTLYQMMIGCIGGIALMK